MRLSGVPVDRIKMIAFVVAGIMAAFGGMLLTARLGSGEVNIGAGYELDIIAAAVIGGLRFGAGSSGVTPIAILLGVAVMSVLRSALSFLTCLLHISPSSLAPPSFLRWVWSVSGVCGTNDRSASSASYDQRL